MKIVRALLSLFFGVLLLAAPTLAQERIPLTILHTNDEHSHLIAHPAVNDHPEYENPAIGGFARLGGMIREIRETKEAEGEPVLAFSGGDWISGPAFGWLALGGHAAELDLLQRMGYTAVVLGNHEFDFGTEVLASYLKTAGYPETNGQTAVLGSNHGIPDDHPLAEAEVQKTVLRDLGNGITAGIFGLIGDDAVSKTAFPEPVVFENYITAGKRAVEQLKEQGADIIIAVTHSGEIEDQILAREVPDIDVIVGGHFHRPLYEPIIEGNTVIVQAGSYTRYLGNLELYWLPNEQRVEIRNHDKGTPFLYKLDNTVPVDEEIAERVAYYEDELNRMVSELTDGLITDIRQTVAVSDFPLQRKYKSESAIGNFITDAMRIITGEVTGERVDVAVQANGAIRGSVFPGTMEWSEGEISFYDLMNTTGLGSGPDGNPGYPVVAFYLTGDEVRRAMEISVLLSEMLQDNYYLQFSGADMEYDPSRALWLTFPVIDQPVPSTRAVMDARIFEGTGIQNNEQMRPLGRDDETLYHVVTDYYIAGFLPMVGELLPGLMVEFKNREGEIISLDDAIVMQDESELKVWQTVAQYALSFGKNGGPGLLPEIYTETGNRLVKVDALPLWFWPGFMTGLMFVVAVVYISRRK